MKGKKILCVCSVVHPYSNSEDFELSRKSIEISAMEKRSGNDIRIFTPRYGDINQRRYQLHEVKRLSGMNLIVNDIDQPLLIKVASVPKEPLQVYFIDNEEFFERKEYWYDGKGAMFDDNAERAIFFVKGVMETVRRLNWIPDIIHIHGWFTHFLPLYVRSVYASDPVFKNVKITVSLYKEDLKTVWKEDVYEKIMCDKISDQWVEEFKNTSTILNLSKTCVKHADLVVKYGETSINEDLLEFMRKEKITVHSVENLKDLTTLHENILPEDS